MYKVFINNKCIVFSGNSEESYQKNARFHKFISDSELLQAIDSFEKDRKADKLIITGETPKILSIFPVIYAAGGVVKKDSGEILFIFRFGKWDLPKGKCEEGEKPEDTALREVTEETGIKGLSIVKELTPTYHTYKIEGKRMMKKTWWYEMSFTDDSAILPQAIEDITQVKWMPKKDLPWAMRDSYASIIELLTQTKNL